MNPTNSQNTSTGYSARVRLWLESDGCVVQLSQVAPDWIIPAERRVLPPSYGIVVVEVDGEQHRYSVYLPDGMSGEMDFVAIRTCVAAA